MYLFFFFGYIIPNKWMSVMMVSHAVIAAAPSPQLGQKGQLEGHI